MFEYNNFFYIIFLALYATINKNIVFSLKNLYKLLLLKNLMTSHIVLYKF